MGRATTTFITGGVRTIGRRGGTTIIHAEDPSLVLDLQFQRDGAYSARRGPLPTFTRASVATRVNSAGLIVPAAIHETRIDYNPTTLACRGLLLEEQRANLTTWSEDVTNAAWGKVNTTATGNTAVAPGGNSSADTLEETKANGQHYVTAGITSISSGTTYTTSVFLKKGIGATAPDWILLSFLAGAFGSKGVAFNVTTGTVGAVNGGQTAQVTQFPNGWWRVSMTATATASVTTAGLYLAFTNNANTVSTPTYVGQTTSDVFVWGAQFEAGAFFATSYIPTTSASVIRSADVCSITGAAFTGFYNQTEGTLVFRGMKAALQSGTPTYAQVDDGSTNNRLLLYKETSGETYSVTAGGVAQVFLGNATIVPANTAFGLATRYKVNDFAMSLSGAAVLTDVSGTLPTVNQLTIGNRLGASFISGWIQSFQYFNAIKTNAQLQALSTP